MSEQVECNCAWNPDSHAETCPVYMQQRIEALRAENAALRESSQDVRALVEALEAIERHNDSPARYDAEINRIATEALAAHRQAQRKESEQ